MENFKRKSRFLSLIENIIKNFGTVILSAILFLLVFVAFFIVRDQLFKSKVEYAAVLKAMPINSEGNRASDINALTIYEALENDAVKREITDSIAVDISYEDFLDNLSVREENDEIVFSFSDKDESYAIAVVNKIFEASTYRILKTKKIKSFTISSPAEFIVDATHKEWTSHDIIWFAGVGAIIGACFALVLICIFFILDNSIKDENDVEKYLALNVLTVIPQDSSTNNSKKEPAKYE